MNWAQAGQVTVCCIVGVWACMRIRSWFLGLDVSATALRIGATVEREQDEVREASAATAHWQGVTTQPEVPDVHTYEYFDLDDSTPESVLNFIRHKHQARLH